MSTKMDPDKFCSVINRYFTIILTTIERWGGDTIKFAGDALLVVWQCGDEVYHRSAWECVHHGILCGQELVRMCNNYIVTSTQNNSFFNDSNVKMDSEPSQDNSFKLNVRSAVSYGHMAGVDVGCFDRWEYLVVGNPLATIGSALEQARQGSVVLTRAAHDIYASGMEPSLVAEQSGVLLVRGFSFLVDGCVAAEASANGFAQRRSRSSDDGRLDGDHRIVSRARDSIVVFQEFELMVWRHVHEAVRPSLEAFHNDERDKASAPHQPTLSPSSSTSMLEAELRNIVTMFINVDVSQVLPHLTDWNISTNIISSSSSSSSSSTNTTSIAPSSISSGSVPQQATNAYDAELLQPLQQCMEIFVTSLREHGGQLRQFLLDDKGCVCIGTFGLRHSVTGDNRAAAVASAQAIVHRLEAMGVGASVGIATGLAYCGLVGSPQRHEYAVMGRSVNLAARLMGSAAKAKVHVLCDETTQLGDKSHSFVRMPDVVAKGYDHKVRTFRPIEYKAASSSEVREDLREYLRTKVDFSFNRVGDLEEIVNFIDDGGWRVGPKMVFAKGTHDIGKSLLLDLVSDFLLWRGRGQGRVSECPVVVLSGRAEMVDTFLPFAAWKSILVHLLRLVDEGVKSSNVGEEIGDGGEGRGTQPDLTTETVSSASSVRGWELVRRKLPPELQIHSSLCVELVLPSLPLSSENKATKSLTGIKRSHQIHLTLVAVVQVAMEILTTLTTPTCSRVVIKLDAIEKMDFWSWELVEALFKSTDVVWLCSMATHVDDRSESLPSTLNSTADNSTEQADYTSSLADSSVVPSNLAALKFLQGLLASHPDQVLPIRLNEFVGFGVKEYLSTLILEHFTNDNGDEGGTSVEDGRDLANVIDMLQATTGGNPMQAQLLVELAAVDNSSVRELKEFLIANSSKFRPDHVEDVLMVEYDRMDAVTQKIHKVASVAAINGAPFTVSALLAMLSSSALLAMLSTAKGESSDVTSELMLKKQFMRKYIKRSNFLGIATHDEFHTLSGHSPPKPMVYFNQRDDESLIGSYIDGTCECEPLIHFRLKSAQEMIYNLLIDDQKVQYHSRLAMHLEAEALSRGGECLSASEWNQQALHWRRSKGWSKAMCCYFQAAKAMDAVGVMADTKRFYCAAHSCLQALKLDGGMAASSTFAVGADGKVTEIEDTGTKRGVSTAGVIAARVVDGVDPDLVLSEQRAVHSVFEGDVMALEIGISMLIRFFQCLLTALETAFVSMVMEEALYFVLATRVPLVTEAETTKASSSLSLSRRLHSNLSLMNGNSDNCTSSSDINELHFCIRNRGVLFPIFSGLAMSCLCRPVLDETELLHLNKVVRTFLTLARDHGDPVHIIRALMFLAFVERIRRNHSTFIHHVDEMCGLYDFEIHSVLFISAYGSDFVPLTVANGAQACARKCDFPKCGVYFSRVLPYLPHISHCHTLTMATFPLFSLFLTLEMFDDACHVIRKLFQTDATWKGFTITRFVLPFLMELSIVLAHADEGSRRAARQGARDGPWADAQSLELLRNGEIVPFEFNVLAAHFIFEVNVAKGYLCLLRAEESMAASNASNELGCSEEVGNTGEPEPEPEPEPQVYLGAALSYVESAIIPVDDAGNEIIIGNKITALHIRARAHALLAQLGSRQAQAQQVQGQSMENTGGGCAAMVEAIRSDDGLEELGYVGHMRHMRCALDECEAVCARLGHPLLALSTALLRMELGAEVEKEDATRRMQEMYHAMSLGSRGWFRGEKRGPVGSEGAPMGYEGGRAGGDAEAWETRLLNAPLLARVKACLELQRREHCNSLL